MTHYLSKPIPISAEMEKRIKRNARQKKEQTYEEIFWFEREHKDETRK